MAGGTGVHLHRGPGQLLGKLIDELLLYAEQEFKLGKVKGGATVEAHLLQAQKSGANVAAELDNPHPYPWELDYLYDWFSILSRTRASGFDHCPIQFSEMQAYIQLQGMDMEPWEAIVITDLDNLWLKEQAKDARSRRTKSGDQQPAGQDSD